MKKLFFAIAAACGCAFFAYSEQVQSWFSGGVASSVPSSVNGAWTSPSEGVTTNEASFTLELGYDETLDFTPTAVSAPDTNVLTRIVVVAQFEPHSGTLPDLPNDTKTALIVSNAAYCAYALDGIAMRWVVLESDDAVEVSEDPVTVLAEVDYKTDSAPRARFGIISDNVTNYLHAVDEEAGSWLALNPGSSPYPAARLVTKVSFAGEGELTSVRGDVQMGLFESKGIKFGTSGEAVTNALTGDVHAIKVLRDNNETIVIPADASVAVTVDSNGHAAGGIDNKSSVATDVKVEIPQETVAQGSGSYTNDVSITGMANLAVTTSDTSKDAVGKLIENGTKIAVDVTTKDSVIENLTVAGKTLTVTDGLKSYLTTYGGKTAGTYSGPNSSSSAIQAQLSAVPTGATRTMGQSYALGLAPTEAVVLQPAAADTSGTTVMLNMPNVKPNNDFTVTYQAQEYKNGTWSDIKDADYATPQVPVGSGRFRVNTVIAPAPAQ